MPKKSLEKRHTAALRAARAEARAALTREERQRQTLHILFGIILVLFAANWGNEATALLLLIFTLAFLTLHWLFLIRAPSPFNAFFEELLRPTRERAIATGAIAYITGALLLFTFLPILPALAACTALAVADGFATIVGRKAVQKLPWNPKKSIDGSTTFFTLALISSLPFIGLKALGLAATLTLVESADLRIDDNLTIPIAALIYFAFAGF